MKIFEIQHFDVVFDLEPNRMIIMRDISDLVEKEYNRSVIKLTEIMLASTSHDMKTPLNTIINVLLILSQQIDDPVLVRLIQAALSSSNLLLFLVNDTLDYFQIKSGKFKIKIAAANIKEMIDNCL